MVGISHAGLTIIMLPTLFALLSRFSLFIILSRVFGLESVIHLNFLSDVISLKYK